MAQQNKSLDLILKLSSLVGFIVMVLPLYLYPLATTDPIDANPFYTSPDYLTIYVLYAFVYFISALMVLLGKKDFIFLLLLGFMGSHFHFLKYFGDKIVFKPLFTTVFIIIPMAIFLTAASWVLLRRNKKDQ